MFCPKCGKEIMDEAVICPKCGCAVQIDCANDSGSEMKSAGKGFCISGLVLGIVSLVFSWIWYISLSASIVGLVLSVVGRKKAKLASAPTGIGTAGMVLSIIGLSITGLVVLFTVVLAGAFVAAFA